MDSFEHSSTTPTSCMDNSNLEESMSDGGGLGECALDSGNEGGVHEKYKCTTCYAEFPTRSKRDVHAAHHSQRKVNFSPGHMLAFASLPNSRILCRCGNNFHSSSIARHARQCQACYDEVNLLCDTHTTLDKPVEPGEADTEQAEVVHDVEDIAFPTTGVAFIGVHLPSGLAICRQCQQGFLPSDVASHLRGKHLADIRKYPFSIESGVSQVTTFCGGMLEARTSTQQPLEWLQQRRWTIGPRIPGAGSVNLGYWCEECGGGYTTAGSMRSHNSVCPSAGTERPGNGTQELSNQVLLQRPVNCNEFKSYIRVTSEEDDELGAVSQAPESVARIWRLSCEQMPSSSIQVQVSTTQALWTKIVCLSDARARDGFVEISQLRWGHDNVQKCYLLRALTRRMMANMYPEQCQLDPFVKRVFGSTGSIDRNSSESSWGFISTEASRNKYADTLASMCELLLLAADTELGSSVLRIRECVLLHIADFGCIFAALGPEFDSAGSVLSACDSERVLEAIRTLWELLVGLFKFEAEWGSAHWHNHTLFMCVACRAWNGDQFDPPDVIRHLAVHLIYWARATMLWCYLQEHRCNTSREHSSRKDSSHDDASRTSREDSSRIDASRTSRNDASRTSRDDASRNDASRTSRNDASRNDASRTSRKDSSRTSRNDASRTSRENSSRTSRDDASRTSREDSSRDDASRTSREDSSHDDASRTSREDSSHDDASRTSREDSSRIDASRTSRADLSRTSRNDASCNGTSHTRRGETGFQILQRLHVFVMKDAPTPCGALLKLNSNMRIADAMYSRPSTIEWMKESDYLALRYNSKEIHFKQIATAYSKALAKIRELLGSLLCGFMPKRDYYKDGTLVHDNIADATVGHGLPDNMNNRFSADKFVLPTYLVSEHKLGEFVYTPTARAPNACNELNAVKWREPAVRDWLKRSDKLMDWFLFAIHVGGSQPARAPELASLTIRNLPNYYRSVYSFASKSCIGLVSSYWKGQNLQQRNKMVVRYLDPHLSDLLLTYLIYIRPCIAILSTRNLGANSEPFMAIAANLHYYLFVRTGERMDARQIREKFTSIFARIIGARFTFNEYRHITRAFGRTLVIQRNGPSDAFLDMESNDSSEDEHGYAHELQLESYMLSVAAGRFNVLDYQAGHTPGMGDMHYARTNESHAFTSAAQFDCAYKASSIWHDGLHTHSSLDMFSSYRLQTMPVHPRTIARQRSINVHHSEHLEHSESVTNKRRCVRAQQTSIIYNNIIHTYNISSSSSAPTPTPTPNHINDNLCNLVDSYLPLIRPANPFTDFRSDTQRDAICHVLEARSNIVVVLPTGGGKSLVYQLPIWLEMRAQLNSVSILISPLTALAYDTVAECRLLGIAATIYSTNSDYTYSYDNGYNLLVASPEAAVSEEFVMLCHRLSEDRGRLRRIIFDEVHLATRWASFRTDMRKLHQLNALASRFVYLSATIPPTQTHEILSPFFSRLTLDNNNPSPPDFIEIRAPTNRPNIAYSIRHVNTYDDAQQELIHIINDTSIVRGAHNGCVIVFCQTIRAVTSMASLLRRFTSISVLEFHGELSVSKKHSAFCAIKECSVQVVVATNALSVGVNFSVHAVIHLGPPDNLLAYAQESGRAGRTGAYASAILLLWSRCHEVQEQCLGQNSEARVELDRLWNWINTSCCRRKLLHTYLDGSYTCCKSVDENSGICDYCTTPAARELPDIKATLQHICGAHEELISTTTERFAASEFPELDDNFEINFHELSDAENDLADYTLSTPSVQQATQQQPIPPQRVVAMAAAHLLATSVSADFECVREFLSAGSQGAIPCLVCHAAGENAWSHNNSKCPWIMGTWPQQAPRNGWRCLRCGRIGHNVSSCQFRLRAPSGVCLFCKLPKSVAGSAHSNNRCTFVKFGDAVNVCAYQTWYNKDYRAQVHQELRVTDSWDSMEQYKTWLSRCEVRDIPNIIRVAAHLIRQQDLPPF